MTKTDPNATEILANEKCEACKTDAPKVSNEEMPVLLASIPEWAVETISGVNQLVRCYSFPNFVAAMEFANQVGELAEAVDHHPSLLVEWGKVSVTWWTHKIHGLHRNDFVMAARTDRLID